MKRLLFGALLAAATLPAQDADKALDSIRLQLGSRPFAQRKPAPLHHRAALVRNTLEETAAMLDRAQGPAASRQLAFLSERLRTSSRILEADFASIDAKLASVGLPAKLDARRDFVRHYRLRLRQAEEGLAALAAAAPALPPEEFRARRDALRAALGAGAPRPDTESVHFARPPASAGTQPSLLALPYSGPWPADSDPWPADSDPPTPGDLAASKIVALTPEIRARAAALNGDPGAIYNWVGAHVEYVPYPGQMQDSASVLWSMRGNDFDQATLLIALLRASGIPARYVAADVSMPRADVREMAGVKDETLFLKVFSGLLGFSLFPSVESSRVVATRVWVEAYLDTPGGKTWMALDPARKRRSFQPGILLQAPEYDRMAYLKSLRSVLPGEPYLDALRADFHKKYPGRGFNEVPFSGTLLPPAPPAAQFPYPIVKLHFRSSEAPASQQHRVRLKLSDWSGNVFVSLELPLPEISLRSITLIFNPASPADQQVLDAFGGLENAPAAAVNLLPEFRLDERVIATGTTPIPAGAVLSMSGAQIRPGEGATPSGNTYQHMFWAGETAAIVIGAHYVSDSLVGARIASFLNRLPAASAAEATRGMLDIAALRYLHRVELDEKRLGDALQFRYYPSDEIGYAVTFASLESQRLFDRPFVVTPARLRIHAWPVCLPFVDLNRSDHNNPALKTIWQLHNDAISALEHEVWEEIVAIPSISTIRILQAAIRDGVSIRTITRANAMTEIPALDLPQSVKDSLQEKISLDATLTIPQRPVAIGPWRGTGWIEEFPDWDFNYIIFDFALLSPGGDTGGIAPPPRPPDQDPGVVGQPEPPQNTVCSDPVNVANGNLFEQITDYTLPSPGRSIVFQRTYNSLAPAAGPLGPGWRHSYQISLKDDGTSAVVQDGSGASLKFRLSGGVYISPPGYDLTLTKDAEGYLFRTKHGVESRFDPGGVLLAIADRNQNALQFSYENGRLRRITAPGGRSAGLFYDSSGRLAMLEDFLGRRVTYEYDAAGRLAAVTNTAGNRIVYAYYNSAPYLHLLKSFTTPEGRVTSFQYYGNGKVARVTLPGGQSTDFVYLPLRNETHVIDPRGLLTTYQYNSLGSVTRIIRPDGGVIDRVYNAAAKLEAQTDAAGYTTRYSYDAAGNLVSVVDPAGREMRFTYDPAFNLPTSFQDAAGNITRFEYDSRGNLIRTLDPLGGETRFTWDASGNPTSRTDAGGNTVTITYDELGNPTAVRDALGNLTTREFDRLGRVTRFVNALGEETWWEYDEKGRVLRQFDPNGRVLSLYYGRDGRLTKTAVSGGQSALFGYDAMGNLTQVTDALGQVARYAYSDADCGCTASSNLSLFRDPAGFVRFQTFDFLDRLTSSANALGHTTRFSYDAQGNLASRTDANGTVTSFQFDSIRRLTARSSSGAAARFVHDANHNLISASNQHVTYTFTYDAGNRLKTFTDSRFNKTLTYSYDRLGRRTSLTDSEGGVFTYAWDANGRLTSVRNPAGATATFTYDAVGRPASLTYSNGVAASYRYDALGQLVSLVQRISGAPQPLASFAYTYDGAGRLVAREDPSGRHGYRYDELDRLAAATHSALPSENYRYDAAGNRLASSTGAVYAYDAAGRLVSAEGATFQYDNNGNLVRRTDSSGTTAYTWDADNQLVRIDLPGGATVAYKYDPFGRRIEKNAGGVVTAYLYDLSSVLLELDSRGAMQARYTHGPEVDQPLMVERGGKVYFYHQDGQANVTSLTGPSGEAVCSHSYDSFGRTQPCRNLPNPYLFAGREYDAESGLYFMRARYYDPSLGRFLSHDPLDLAGLLVAGQDRRAATALLPASSAAVMGPASTRTLRNPQNLNPYSYALNNPLSFRDPSGLKCRPWVRIGWEPSEWNDGASQVFEGPEGFIDDFDGWLKRNNYGVEYQQGYYAIIYEYGQHKVVGVVKASSVGFQERPFEAPPGYLQSLQLLFSEIGNTLSSGFQLSLRVPWHKLQGQEYWDAMKNPENYVHLSQ